MSSAGHVLDAINRSKQNLALRKAAKNRYKVVKEAYLKHAYKDMKYVDKNKLTAEELNELKNKIRLKIINERRQFLIKSITLTVIFVIIVTVVLIYNFKEFIWFKHS